MRQGAAPSVRLERGCGRRLVDGGEQASRRGRAGEKWTWREEETSAEEQAAQSMGLRVVEAQLLVSDNEMCSQSGLAWLTKMPAAGQARRPRMQSHNALPCLGHTRPPPCSIWRLLGAWGPRFADLARSLCNFLRRRCGASSGVAPSALSELACCRRAMLRDPSFGRPVV